MKLASKGFLSIALCITLFQPLLTAQAMLSSCQELIGSWKVPPDNMKGWKVCCSPEIIIYGLKPIPRAAGFYNLKGCINGRQLIDSKCIEQPGYGVVTVSLITPDFFLRSNYPDPTMFCGFCRSRFCYPSPPKFFGLL